MPARERARRRSRAWLVLPAAPVIVGAFIAGGSLAALLVAVAATQVAALSSWAPDVGDRVARVVGGGPAWRHRAKILGRAGRGVIRPVPTLVGAAVMLVAIDLGLGAVVDRLTGQDHAAVDPLDLAEVSLPDTTDERAGAPAYADSPWADRYFAELAAVPFTYVPFVGPREEPVRGRHINSTAGIRASFQPDAPGEVQLPEVWFFGGSTLWGEGQRDEHTIPSEVARLAADAGQPVNVVNFGERGYTAFQEFLLFEQELSRRPAPDLAVFYHGANEMYSLLEEPGNLGSQPSTYQYSVYRRAFHRAPPLPSQVSPVEPSLVEGYRRTAALPRAVYALVPPAEADDTPTYVPPLEAIERALVEAEQIYRRSVRLIRHEAEVADVPIVVLWQPAGVPPRPPARDDYGALTDRVATYGGGIDLSDALLDAPGPVYIDLVHTNELGARIVAEAVWPHVAAALPPDDRP